MFTPKSVQPGERIIRAGERGDAMYFLSSGRVDVTVRDKQFKLGPGAYFGEMALLSGAPRTADVTALDFSTLLVLSRRDFNLFMSRHPELRVAVEEMARERTALNVAAVTDGDGRVAGPIPSA
jgi:CPA2 family monovalent cation:H+ antiporter-2